MNETRRDAIRRQHEFVNQLSLNPATAQGDLEAVARLVTESCSQLLGLAQVGVWLFDETETELRCFDQFNAIAGAHSAGGLLREHEFEPEFRALKASLYVDASAPLTDSRTAGYVEGYIKPQRITSMLDLVIRFGGKNLGTLCFEHIDNPHQWEQDEIDFGLLVCAQLSILLERRALKRTEAARREIQERLAATLHSIADGVVSTDNEGRVTDMNAVAEGLTGWSAADARGHDIETVVCLVDLVSEHVIECERLTGEARSLVRSQSREIALSTKDGVQRRVAYDVAQIRLDDQRVIGAVVVLRDVAEEIRMSEELVQARKIESVGVLAGGLAHDLNNILSPIILVADALLQSLAQSPNEQSNGYRAHLETIHAAALRASEVTRKLLTFARRQPVAFRPIDLNAVVVDFLGLLRRTIRENIVFQTHLSLRPVVFSGDRGQIEQVLLNLVVNAQDAMPRGGVLVIETSEAHFERSSSACGLGRGSHVLLTVKDTGIGMQPSTVQRIFDPFFTTKQGKGSGLGLASAYGIVRQHRGDIEVESALEAGSTFKIYFPRVEQSDFAEPLDATPPIAELRGTEVVLLVDDESLLCNVVSEVLRGQGYTVMQASTTSAAIELAHEHRGRIDLLLTDVVMPGMNGKELLARLSGTNAKLKVLYMSAYQHEVIAQQGILERGVELLHKPFSRVELLHKVRRTLDQC